MSLEILAEKLEVKSHTEMKNKLMQLESRTIKDTLYSKYIAERSNAKIIENECGFVIYKFNGAECFILDFFILKEARKSGNAKNIIEKLVEVSKENKCSHITANIFLDDVGASNTLTAALLIGFKVVSSAPGVILIAKKIGD